MLLWTYFEAEKDHSGAEAESDERDGTSSECAVYEGSSEHLTDLHETDVSFSRKLIARSRIADFDFGLCGSLEGFQRPVGRRETDAFAVYGFLR